MFCFLFLEKQMTINVTRLGKPPGGDTSPYLLFSFSHSRTEIQMRRLVNQLEIMTIPKVADSITKFTDQEYDKNKV
jgi:hypothetical protein